MAIDSKAIKQKISAVGNVRKVTKTMEMVSVAKMKKAVENRKKTADYAKYALNILGHIASLKDVQHPMFNNRESGKQLLVIIASDKGLCGPYNARVERQVVEFIGSHDSDKIDVIAVGKRAKKIADKYDISIKESQLAFTEKDDGSEVRELIETIKALYVQDRTYRTVNVIFTEFISSLEFTAVNKQLLPINHDTLPSLLGISEEEVGEAKVYTLEPNEEVILEELLPALLQVGVYQFSLESLASEHSSRMLAMRNASDNASRLKDELTGEYNRARQAGVTKEIIEIVNAASAV